MILEGSRIHVLKVQADGTHNILVRRQPLIDDVGIIDDITAENETASDSKDNIHSAAEREDETNKARHNESNQGTEEERPHSRKVVLGLEGEEGQTKEDAKGNQASKSNEPTSEFIVSDAYSACRTMMLS